MNRNGPLVTGSWNALENVTSRISTDLSEIKCSLWTDKTGQHAPFEFKLDVHPKLLLENGFDPKRETKFIVHGWNSNSLLFSRLFVEAYFSNPKTTVNLISIDWTALASWDNYFVCARNAVRLGKLTGQVLGVDLLIKSLGQDPMNIHAIGFSAGAHLVGHFGRVISESVNGKIARITALDPAKPYFDMPPKSNRLSHDDALLVDVIHTNSGMILEVVHMIFLLLKDRYENLFFM